ncbi:hypothetical protein B0H14DRAFT_3483979 [Mycena olivaceomarginata]|nr:hypothetical protein B0H14DRAFT_3483979 [Mycena olivaceomarginata]
MLAARFKRHDTTVRVWHLLRGSITHSACSALTIVPSITLSFALFLTLRAVPSSIPSHLRPYLLLLPPPSPCEPVAPFLTSPPHNCAPALINVLRGRLPSLVPTRACGAVSSCRLALLQTSVMRSRRCTCPPHARNLPSSSLHFPVFLTSSSPPALPAPYASPLPPLFPLHSSPYAAGHTPPSFPPLALLGTSSIHPHTHS